MVKCGFCGKEVLYPFECSYCGKAFCPEHRLPESHQCGSLPTEPFWYHKRKDVELENKRSDMLKEGEFFFVKKPRVDTKDLLKTSKPKAKTHFKIPIGKIFFLGIMLAVAFIYIPAMEWATNLNVGEGIISYLPWAFVLAMCHELLHALAWWSFGYSAIPIPILIPPILGITLGEKPRRRRENFVISVAPILLTISSAFVYHMTGNRQYLVFGVINLVGMLYDFISIFR